MSFLRNIKDWFTDTLGAVIMAVSCYFYFWKQTIDQTGWLASMGVGFVLLWVPDEIILKHLKKKAKKKLDLEDE